MASLIISAIILGITLGAIVGFMIRYNKIPTSILDSFFSCKTSSWGAWSNCTGSCNQGTKTQYRNAEYCSATTALSQTQDCTFPCGQDCEWNWSPCSATCGSGLSTQVITTLAMSGGTACPYPLESVTCNTGTCPSWIYQGCFNDSVSNRAIPQMLVNNISFVSQCELAANTDGGVNVIGIQDGDQCFGGLNSNYSQYGPATGCAVMGGNLTSQVYVFK
jgi:hypothetical protein